MASGRSHVQLFLLKLGVQGDQRRVRLKPTWEHEDGATGGQGRTCPRSLLLTRPSAQEVAQGHDEE